MDVRNGAFGRGVPEWKVPEYAKRVLFPMRDWRSHIWHDDRCRWWSGARRWECYPGCTVDAGYVNLERGVT